MKDPSEILDVTSAYYGVPLSEMRGRGRTRSVAHARHMAMYLLTAVARRSDGEAAQMLDRHRTSVLNGRQKIAGFMDVDETVREEVNEIKEMLAA